MILGKGFLNLFSGQRIACVIGSELIFPSQRCSCDYTENEVSGSTFHSTATR